MAKTSAITKRIQEMDALEAGQRDVGAKTDYLLSHLAAGRGMLEALGRLRKHLPQGVAIRELRFVDPAERRDRRGAPTAESERSGASFVFRGKGNVRGEIESEENGVIRLKGQGDGYPITDIVGPVVRYPLSSKSLLIAGEIDESVRGGPRQALEGVVRELTDPARGLSAKMLKQSHSPDKPGWRVFEMMVSFE
jgi:hypothetical protein